MRQKIHSLEPVHCVISLWTYDLKEYQSFCRFLASHKQKFARQTKPGIQQYFRRGRRAGSGQL